MARAEPNATSNFIIFILLSALLLLDHYTVSCWKWNKNFGVPWVWFITKFLFQQVKLPSHECHFKVYWMKGSFALGYQRWCCHGNSFYCYQSSTVWQVNHLFKWIMILSHLDSYSCRRIAKEQKIRVRDDGADPGLKEHSSVLTSVHNTDLMFSFFLQMDGNKFADECLSLAFGRNYK